jgi:diguanylate cyclase (GGDEF)-like protein
LAKHTASDAARNHPDHNEHIPDPSRDWAAAAYPGDGSGDGPAFSDWERVYLAARPKRLAGATEQKAAPLSHVEVVAEHARESAHQDELAWQRDLAAEARDRAAERRDRAMHEREEMLAKRSSIQAALVHAADLRTEAAGERAMAADDRRQAALDRLRAAEERDGALTALKSLQLDDLTGTYRRAVGKDALGAEIERARSDGDPVVLAIVDVAGLKEVNDQEGHLAGDRLLCDVVATIQANIRAYEPIVRLGGDEFAFTIAGLNLDGARERISKMRGELSERSGGGRFSVGLAEVRPGDSLGDALRRADEALLDAHQPGPR